MEGSKISSNRKSASAGIFDDLESEEDEFDDEDIDPRRIDHTMDLAVWYFRAQGFVIGIVVTSLVWFLAS